MIKYQKNFVNFFKIGFVYSGDASFPGENTLAGAWPKTRKTILYQNVIAYIIILFAIDRIAFS